jgi:hypothetical protein
MSQSREDFRLRLLQALGIQSGPQPRRVASEKPLRPGLSSEALILPIELGRQVGFMRTKR